MAMGKRRKKLGGLLGGLASAIKTSRSQRKKTSKFFLVPFKKK